MISEEQQDQAALYVLGALRDDELAAFEADVVANAELRGLVRELSEAAGNVAFLAPARLAPAELKQRVMRAVSEEKRAGDYPARVKIPDWVPWAIAAGVLFFCGVLAVDLARVKRELAEARSRDPLSAAAMVALAPSGPAPAEARAMVAWEGKAQSGVIHISNLPPQSGKDYQLWIIDADHADPISAGIIHVDTNGTAQVRFKPIVAANHVKAFAISLEREGGVPKAEGPILLAGSTI